MNETLAASSCDQAQAFEQLFPTYTGSMTALIESSFGHCLIKSRVLAQSYEPVEGFLADTAVAHGFPLGKLLLYRRAVLYATGSQQQYLYASTLINVSAFPASIVRQIQEQPSEPLGRVIGELPIAKTLLSTWHRENDPFLLQLFSATGARLYHGRRVLFSLHGQAAMLLEEIIPCRCGLLCPLVPQAQVVVSLLSTDQTN